MKRILSSTLVFAGLLLSPTAVDAKQKAKPATGTSITANDLRNCMGLNTTTPDEQIAVCTKIINSGKVKPPHHGDYYATRGSAYFAKGDVEKAMADFNKAIGIRQAPEFYFERGLLNTSIREWDAAKSDLDHVLKLKPAFAPAYLARGIVSYRMADFQEALSYFDGAVQRSPTFYKGLFARGVTKKKLGNDAGGEKDIADARGMSPKVDEDLAKLGVKP